MQLQIARHALDRVPISLLVEDSSALVNINYFLMRDRRPELRWEDVPIVYPESFTREFGEWCLEQGIRGKYSVVPCPAALGRIDEGLPLFSKAQLTGWLKMCREVIAPAFDITPEMMTHTFVVDLETFRPVEPERWESDWSAFSEADEEPLIDYIAAACQILENVGLTPRGASAPGGFGNRTLERLARVVGLGHRKVTGNPTPFFFKRSSREASVETPVWHANREAGTAVGEIILATGAWTGSWTGYGEVSVDKYITADLQGGRLPAVIDAGDPATICSHWQAFYGIHNADRRGFEALKEVVGRLRARDPNGERTQWRRVSEVTTYACAREMAEVRIEGYRVQLDLPVRVPDFTLRLSGVDVRGVSVDGQSLRQSPTRAAFKSGTFFSEGDITFIAFDPVGRHTSVEIHV